MTPHDRILAAYRGEQPDVVPYMLDLSHWSYHKNRLSWDLSVSYALAAFILAMEWVLRKRWGLS